MLVKCLPVLALLVFAHAEVFFEENFDGKTDVYSEGS
jgi:hypothetical protein